MPQRDPFEWQLVNERGYVQIRGHFVHLAILMDADPLLLAPQVGLGVEELKEWARTVGEPLGLAWAHDPPIDPENRPPAPTVEHLEQLRATAEAEADPLAEPTVIPSPDGTRPIPLGDIEPEEGAV